MKLLMMGDYPLKEISGGVERVMVTLVGELKQYQGFKIHVVTTTKETGRDVTIKRDGPVIHYLASPKKIPYFLSNLTIDYLKIKNKTKEIRPDIIHSHNLLFAASALKSKIPTVVTIHGIATREAKLRKGIARLFGIFYAYQFKKLLKNTKHIIAISDYSKKVIEPLTGARIYQIPNPLDSRFFSCAARESEQTKGTGNKKPGRLLFVGKIWKVKGLEELLRALKIVVGQEPATVLNIAGEIREKDYYNKLVRYIRGENLGSHVNFLGNLKFAELISEYKSCDIFVLFSHQENQPLTVLEAMACGKAVIASDAGNMPDMIDNNLTGLVVKRGNYQALAEKILFLLANPGRGEEMGIRAKEKVRREYDSKIIARKTYELYRKLLAQVS